MVGQCQVYCAPLGTMVGNYFYFHTRRAGGRRRSAPAHWPQPCRWLRIAREHIASYVLR